MRGSGAKAATIAAAAAAAAAPEAKRQIATSGKTPLTSLPTVEDLPLDDIEIVEDVGKSKGWRLEVNSNKMHRWRWQMKDSSGKTITYITKSGNVGYKRGSKYVGKKE